VKLKVIVKRPQLARRANRREAAVGRQRGANLQGQPDLGQVGFKLLFFPGPANWQLKAANFDLGTGQITAGLSDTAGLSAAEHLLNIQLQPLEPMRQSDFQQLTLARQNANAGRT
jgi:hypothetical protein